MVPLFTHTENSHGPTAAPGRLETQHAPGVSLAQKLCVLERIGGEDGVEIRSPRAGLAAKGVRLSRRPKQIPSPVLKHGRVGRGQQVQDRNWSAVQGGPRHALKRERNDRPTIGGVDGSPGQELAEGSLFKIGVPRGSIKAPVRLQEMAMHELLASIRRRGRRARTVEIVQNCDPIRGPGVRVLQTAPAPQHPATRLGDPDDSLLGLGERQRKKVPLHPPRMEEARRMAGQLGRALDGRSGEGPETLRPRSAHFFLGPGFGWGLPPPPLLEAKALSSRALRRSFAMAYSRASSEET